MSINSGGQMRRRGGEVLAEKDVVVEKGEDVVAGTRTPQHITKKARINSKQKKLSMEESMPSVYKKLKGNLLKLGFKNWNYKQRTIIVQYT